MQESEYGKEIKRLLVHIINILNINFIMDKKVLKMYETPAVEVVDLKLDNQILAGSPKTDPFDGNTEETPEVE